MKRPVAFLTAKSLSAETVALAYAIVAELEGKAEQNFQTLLASLRKEVPEAVWAQVVRAIEAYRDLAVQSALTAITRGHVKTMMEFLEELGAPISGRVPEMPDEEELKQALSEVRVGDRFVSLANSYGMEPSEILLAQAVGAAIEDRYQRQDEALLTSLLEVGTSHSGRPVDRDEVDKVFAKLATLSARKLAEMLVATYAAGRRRGEAAEWERIRRWLRDLE